MRKLASYLLSALSAVGETEHSACDERSQYFHLAARMVESNVQRNQLTPSTESSAFIEQVCHVSFLP